LSRYLLDTDVISMLAPARKDALPEFVAWLEAADAADRIVLSVVTIHEIEKGIALLAHKGAVTRANALRLWLAGLVTRYDDAILAFDAAAATLAGQLEARAIAAGHAPGMADAMIAAIAQVHDCVVLTRNTRHFLPFGIAVVTPEEMIA